MENSNNTRSSFRIIPWLLNCIFTTNCKNIGLLYLLFCFVFGTILIKVFNHINFNIFIILNICDFSDILLIKIIILIIFYVLFPILFCGFNNIIIPLMLKCEELMFPRINNISFWIFCLSFLIMLESVLYEVNSEIYLFYLFPFNVFSFNLEHLFIYSLYLYSFSLFLQSINYICTIIKTKTKLSIFVFTTLSTSLFLIFYLPILTIIIELILLKNNHCHYFFYLFFEKKNLIFLNFQLYWFLFYPIIWLLVITSWGFGVQILMNNIKKSFFFELSIKFLILLSNFVCLFFWLKIIILEDKYLNFAIEDYFNSIWIIFIFLFIIYVICLLTLTTEKNFKFTFSFFSTFCFFFYQSFLIFIFFYFNDLYGWSFIVSFFSALIFSSVLIISISIFFWILPIYNMSYYKTLAYIHFIPLFAGLIIFSKFYFQFIKEFDISCLELILCNYSSILVFSFLIFLINLIIAFLFRYTFFFFKWCANNYIMFIISIRVKEKFPEVFIYEASLIGGIFTRIFLWNQDIFVFEKLFRIIIFSYFFVFMCAILLYFPYALIVYYKEKTLIGKLLGKFLLYYADDDLNMYFFSLIHK